MWNWYIGETAQSFYKIRGQQTGKVRGMNEENGIACILRKKEDTRLIVDHVFSWIEKVNFVEGKSKKHYISISNTKWWPGRFD